MATEPVSKDWLQTTLLQGFLKNGFAKSNGNKSWVLTDLQYLSLTDDFAKGFLTFAKTPGYKKQFFELELRMIKEQADAIKDAIGEKDFNLIDIYCGDGFKARELIKEINSKTNGSLDIRYFPMNASQHLLDLAVKNMKEAKIPNVVEYNPILSSGDGRSLRNIAKNLKDKKFTKNVVVLLGGVIACFDINEYLFELNRDLDKDDVLIMANGVRVGERLVELDKYQSEATFHNWFKHVMLGLGFKEEDVEFDARFGNSRIEFFYTIKKEMKAKVNGKEVVFKPGDEFVVAALYKYYAEEFEKFCKMYFANSQVFTDESKEYALVISKK